MSMLDFFPVDLSKCAMARAHAVLQVLHLQGDFCLDDNVCIRRIPNTKIAEVQEEMKKAWGDHPRWAAQFEVFRDYELHATTLDDFNEQSRPIERQFSEILAALRLLHPGSIDFGGLTIRPRGDQPQTPITGYFKGKEITPQAEILELPHYTLGVADVPSLEQLLILVRKYGLLDQFFFQCFSDSYYRSAASRSLDCAICLEGLLAPETGTEIKYRFAIRGAAILGESVEEREMLFRLLGAIYDLRSAIVHGHFHEDAKVVQRLLSMTEAKSLWEIAFVTMNLARRAILKYLEDPSRFSDEALNRLLLGNCERNS